MKTFFTLLLSSLFSLTIFAADDSRLSISTFNRNVDLKIEVDGKKVIMNDDNSITIRNLREGYHSVKIFRQKKQKKNGQGQAMDILYNSSVYVKKGFHMDITINRFGKVLTDERRIDRNDEWYFDDEDEYFDDVDYHTPNVISNRDLDQVKESLRKEWLESNRLNSAKFIIGNNNFTTLQIRGLMDLFTFESNKLEIAKAGYSKTIDRNNYFLLNEALTFSNSKDELARFIRNYR